MKYPLVEKADIQQGISSEFLNSLGQARNCRPLQLVAALPATRSQSTMSVSSRWTKCLVVNLISRNAPAL